MRLVIQRVDHARLDINEVKYSEIGKGLLILLGIEEEDNRDDIDWTVRKVINMRIFPDDEGKMNMSLLDTEGDIMVVSQFTLHASTKKGNRPSFIKAASPDHAVPLYEGFISKCQSEIGPSRVATGQFGAHMNITLKNNGPVTIFMDSKNKE